MNDSRPSSQDPHANGELAGVLLKSVEAVLSEPLEEADIARALGRAREIGQGMVLRRPRPFSRILLGAATAVAFLAAVVLILPLWHSAESVAWAEVVEAVAKRPWLHSMETWEDGSRKESWYSASRAIEGSHYMPSGPDHGRERYTWIDFAQEKETDYFPDTRRIVRGTQSKSYWQAHKFFSAALGTAFLSCSLGETVQAGNFEIVDQQESVVVERGKRSIHYRFRWRQTDKEAKSATEFAVLVDPETRLPFRLDLINPGEKPIPFSQMDYPADGPTDIYAMGVPKSAEIVDCALRPDVEQLAKATVAAGCREDIEFSALVVHTLQDQHWGYRAWKKGLRWRIDTTVDPLSPPPDDLSSKEADLARWWRQHAEKVRFRPDALFDGKWHWQYSVETRRPNQTEIDAGMDKGSRVVVSTEKRRLLPYARDYYWEDEPLCLMGHPTTLDDSPPSGLPIYSCPNGPCLGTINQTPKDGPPNCVLLELRNPVWKLDDSGARRWVHPQTVRCWIDPERDYSVMRRDDLISRGGKEEMIGGFVIESLTQDPRKRWFPTVVRQFVHILPPDSHKDLEEIVLCFYYDFTTPVPDGVFHAD